MRPIIIDTETSGRPEDGEVGLVEVAAISRREDGSLKKFEELVNPGHLIPAPAMAVHHITNRMVENAAPAEQVLSKLRAEMGAESGEIVWVAHNAEFDKFFLPGFADDPWICTYRCALHLWPDAPSHGNQALRYWLGLDESGELQLPEGLYPHRALYDILVTEGILRRLLSEVVHKRLGGDADSRAGLLELVRLSTEPVILSKARFGKHAGKAWDWIVRADSGWCDWYMRLPDGDKDVRHTIQHHRERAPVSGHGWRDLR